ncbi:MAG: sterol desaturase family protein [Pseudomonadota bacterium]
MISNWLAPLLSDWPVPAKFLIVGVFIAGLVMLRYSLFTAVAFGAGVLVDKISPWRRLQKTPFTFAQIRREFLHSISSVLMFTLVIGGIILMTQAGWTKIYSDPAAFGWVWFIVQIPVALLIQDLYFYWMHRACHLPHIYERAHKTHHLSTNPSAFAAFAFHPIEALLEIAIFVPLVILVPMAVPALITVGAISLLFNVYGHLGYEVMPRIIANSPIGYWLNKSAYHNQHHRAYKYNYGLYTVIWDRLHGTLHPHADRLYDQATTTSTKTKDSVSVRHGTGVESEPL